MYPELPHHQTWGWPRAVTNPFNSAVKLGIYENKVSAAAEGDVRKFGFRAAQKLLEPEIAEQLLYLRVPLEKL